MKYGKESDAVSQSDGTKKSKQVSDFSEDTTEQSSVNIEILENTILIWLDSNNNEQNNDDFNNTVTQLRNMVNMIQRFTNPDECIDFVTNIDNQNVILIISGASLEPTVALIQDIPILDFIFIFCKNKAEYEQWAKQCPKIKGIFTDVPSMCQSLQQIIYQYEQNNISFGFMTSNDVLKKELNQVDCSFMYTKILKEILLDIKFEQKHREEFINYCREQFADNKGKLIEVQKLETEYDSKTPIWWYTYLRFLYIMLNHALRTMEVDMIVKMGFFLVDLHQQTETLYLEHIDELCTGSPITVYRGQSMSKKDFEQMINTKGGLMSFNSFLSTSTRRDVSLAWAESTQQNSDSVGILFDITINPSESTTPFASISGISNFEDENEVLFSMHTVFRIGNILPMGESHRLFQVNLTLTSDTDKDLRALTNRIREEIPPQAKGWERLGAFLIHIRQLDKAEQVYQVLLGRTTRENLKSPIYSQLGTIKYHQGKYEESVKFFEKTLTIDQRLLPSNHHNLAVDYNNIGGAYYSMGKYSEALSHHKEARKIQRQLSPSNYLDLASSCNSIGAVYNSMGKYSNALSSYEEAFQIRQQSLPQNHPDLASSYNNIGNVYYNMVDYSKALSFYEKALAIQRKSLPSNHPDVASSFMHIGAAHHKMNEYSKALSSYEEGLAIQQQSLHPNHPYLAAFYSNIGIVYNSMGQYSEALSFYEKAIAIQQHSLPSSHPDLAASCHNIAVAYKNIGNYSKARSFYEHAVDIGQRSLPPDHPNLNTYIKHLESIKIL